PQVANLLYGTAAYIQPLAAGPPSPASRPAVPNDAVNVTIGTLPAGKRIIMVFRALINNPPIPAGVNNISNQGTVSGSNFSSVLTDDPDTGTLNDPTLTPLDAAPDLVILKADDGQTYTVGQTVTYTLSYSNTGTQGATGAV